MCKKRKGRGQRTRRVKRKKQGIFLQKTEIKKFQKGKKKQNCYKKKAFAQTKKETQNNRLNPLLKAVVNQKKIFLPWEPTKNSQQIASTKQPLTIADFKQYFGKKKYDLNQKKSAKRRQRLYSGWPSRKRQKKKKEKEKANAEETFKTKKQAYLKKITLL